MIARHLRLVIGCLCLVFLGFATAWSMSKPTGRVGVSPTDSLPLKVVVHINFGDSARQGHGLKNIENIVKAAEAAHLPTEIEVVCHSDGITLLEKAKTGQANAVEALQKTGVRFAACRNTMSQRSILPEHLIPLVTTVASGAFEVVMRQRDGYSYFKP